jgi:hypothetical protein
MTMTRVRCPDCTVILEVPADYKAEKVRCSVCRVGFRVPAYSDKQIADWIGPRFRDDTAVVEREGDLPHSVADEPEVSIPRPSRISRQSVGEDLTAGVPGFRIVRISSRGVLFEFPASFLRDIRFRSAMPRRCLRCGTIAHIQPHLIIFGHEMHDSSGIDAEYVDGPSQLSETEARNLPAEEILQKLPSIRNIPAPADHPMPYWICDMCSPSNMIYAQNEIHKDGEGTCRLQIRRLWRAEEFLINAGGEDSGADQAIKKELEKNPELPWDTLSGVVQQRLRQWYSPRPGERFVAYMPDRRRARTEDGMAGVLISNRRLIYHSSMRHRESDKGEPIELDFRSDQGQMRLHIKTPSWEAKNMIVDKASLSRLRRALHKENFNAKWH